MQKQKKQHQIIAKDTQKEALIFGIRGITTELMDTNDIIEPRNQLSLRKASRYANRVPSVKEKCERGTAAKNGKLIKELDYNYENCVENDKFPITL